MSKGFNYKDIGQHGHSYNAPAAEAENFAPKLKLPKQKPAGKLHRRLRKSLTLVRPKPTN